MSDERPYFHEQDIHELRASKLTFQQAAQQYRAPPWCRSGQSAIDALGCWSLIGGYVTGKDYCKNCSEFRDD